MKRIIIQPVFFFLFLFFSSQLVIGQYTSIPWNQFRGPERNGTTPEEFTMPDDIDSSIKLRWKKPIGSGFSELTHEANIIYTMESEKIDSISGNEFVSCYDALTGTQLWKTKVDSMFFDTFGDGPRSTPVIGEHLIFSLSSYGKLTALRKTSGEITWQVDVLKSFGPTLPRWGFSSSPMLIENTLVIEAGGSESRAFMGFNKETGEVKWENGTGIATYCSPILATIEGVEQIIFANQQTLYSLSSTGDTIWTYKLSISNPTAMPVFFEGNKLFVSSLAGKGFSILEIKGKQITEVFRGNSMKNDYSSSLYHDKHFYGFNVAALQCISAQDGSKKWTKRGLGKGSLIKVDNTLLALSDKGKLVFIQADHDAYKEIGNIQALEGKSWTAPSFSEGRIFLRNLTEMACYEFTKS